MDRATNSRHALCEVCQRKFEKNDLLQNRQNVFCCKECFRRKYCPAMLGSGDTKLMENNDNSQNMGRSFMIPNPEIYYKPKEPANLLLNKHSVTSMMSLSKRPLRCPKPDCNKYISTFTLESHFKTEHKEVHIVSTQIDARCVSEFYPSDIRYGITQCNILLKVIDQEFLAIPHCRQNQASRHSKTVCSFQNRENNPVMVLLATRVPGFYLDEEQDNTDELNRTQSQYYIDNDIMRDSDKILIWLASNVATNLSYTVAASTLDNEIRQKYFGPIPTLNETPQKLCKEGNGLILTNLHCNRMSENWTKPLSLDIVIHGPE